MDCNHLNTASVAAAAVAQGVKRFVYCSGMTRYGHQEVVPFTEDMTCKSQNPYGISKVASIMINLMLQRGQPIIY